MADFLSTSTPAGWESFFSAQKKCDYWSDLVNFVSKEYQNHTVYPPASQIFAALDATPPEEVRCIILGQDPYHGPGQAHGLAFSVPAGQNWPPSLKNIFKEYQSDLGLPPPLSGDLTTWAKRGVLLLNTVLTVREGRAGSHAKKGWERFTFAVLNHVLERSPNAGFICFGKPALTLAESVIAQHPLRAPVVVHTPHPSPLSAYRGFFGAKPFTTFTYQQEKKGRESVPWELPSSTQTELF